MTISVDTIVSAAASATSVAIVFTKESGAALRCGFRLPTGRETHDDMPLDLPFGEELVGKSFALSPAWVNTFISLLEKATGGNASFNLVEVAGFLAVIPAVEKRIQGRNNFRTTEYELWVPPAPVAAELASKLAPAPAAAPVAAEASEAAPAPKRGRRRKAAAGE